VSEAIFWVPRSRVRLPIQGSSATDSTGQYETTGPDAGGSQNQQAVTANGSRLQFDSRLSQQSGERPAHCLGARASADIVAAALPVLQQPGYISMNDAENHTTKFPWRMLPASKKCETLAALAASATAKLQRHISHDSKPACRHDSPIAITILQPSK